MRLPDQHRLLGSNSCQYPSQYPFLTPKDFGNSITCVTIII